MTHKGILHADNCHQCRLTDNRVTPNKGSLVFPYWIIRKNLKVYWLNCIEIEECKMYEILGNKEEKSFERIVDE